MKTGLIALLIALSASYAHAATNVAPTVQIVSAAIRPGTTLMDVTYRITDPDDATVKVRALAFKDGVRSFANVIRPVTFVEGTATNIGDAITAGVNHTLTWEVRTDWNIDLAQVKFEVLCRDSRPLLSFNWLTIPATSNTAALTISTGVPSGSQVLNALFWMYADGDPWLIVSNGNLKGTAASGIFSNEVLVSGSSLQSGTPTIFVYKKMNICRATVAEKDLAILARSTISSPYDLSMYAVNRPWDESRLGSDPTAITSTSIANRWVKHTYASGNITMSDRFNGVMWFYTPFSVNYVMWADAFTYCSGSTYAGYHDWQLPVKEWLEFMYFQKGFFNYNPQIYWSSSDGCMEYVHSTFGPCAVNFSTGETIMHNPGYGAGVWPMRRGN